MEKKSDFLSKTFLFLKVKISIYLNRRVFVMLVKLTDLANEHILFAYNGVYFVLLSSRKGSQSCVERDRAPGSTPLPFFMVSALPPRTPFRPYPHAPNTDTHTHTRGLHRLDQVD